MFNKSYLIISKQIYKHRSLFIIAKSKSIIEYFKNEIHFKNKRKTKRKWHKNKQFYIFYFNIKGLLHNVITLA
jgi:hypothetical protein